MPGSDALCRERHAGQGADTPAMVTFASAPVPRGRLTAFGCTLASRDGSDLLPLRLLLLLQLGDAVFHAAQSGTFTSFARPAHSPRLRFLCAPGPAKDLGLLAGWTRRETHSRAGATVAAKTLWVTVSVRGSKRSPDLTRFARGF